MASSNSETVFGGLTFRSIDNRKMQELLKYYSRLPSRPTDRRALWANIQTLDIDLNTEDHYLVQHWYKFGGTLPTVRTELQEDASLATTTPAETVAEAPPALQPTRSFFNEARRLGDENDEEAHNPFTQPPAVLGMGGQVLHEGFRVPSNPYLRRPPTLFNDIRRLGEDGEGPEIMTSMPSSFAPALEHASDGTDDIFRTTRLPTESRRLSDGGEEPGITNSIPTLYPPTLPASEMGINQMLLADQLESRRLGDGAEEDPMGALLAAVTASDPQHHRQTPSDWRRHRRSPAHHLQAVPPQPSAFNESRRLGAENEGGEEANKQHLPTSRPGRRDYTNSPSPVDIGLAHLQPGFPPPFTPGHRFARFQPGNALPIDPDQPFNHLLTAQNLLDRDSQMHNGPFQLPHIQPPHTGRGHFTPLHQHHHMARPPPIHPGNQPFNPHLGPAPSINPNNFMPFPFQSTLGRRLGAEGEDIQESEEVPNKHHENTVSQLPGTSTVPPAPPFGNGSMQPLLDAVTIHNSAVRTTAVDYIQDQDMDDFDDSDNEDQLGIWHRSRSGYNPRRPPPPEPIECDICAEFRLPSEFPSSKITVTCSHETVACFECMRNVISIAVESNNLDNINCPLCPTKLVKANIKRFASAEVFKRYEYLHFRRSLPDTYISCLAPRCGAGQIHESDDIVMICHACSFKTCVFHKLPWHEGKTCQEFDDDESQIDRLEQDEATAKLLAESSKLCPKCKQGVTKEVGCDHMACVCGEAWCYVCMASWENIMRLGDTAHARTCSYHPDSVRLRRDQIEGVRSQMTELVHGGEVSEELLKARDERNKRVRESIRPRAALAAEARMKEIERERREKALMGGSEGSPEKKKKKTKLVPAWDESQILGSRKKRAF